jgi:hypothetical protein
LDDEKAALLETLAVLHAALPLPVGWRPAPAPLDSGA